MKNFFSVWLLVAETAKTETIRNQIKNLFGLFNLYEYSIDLKLQTERSEQNPTFIIPVVNQEQINHIQNIDSSFENAKIILLIAPDLLNQISILISKKIEIYILKDKKNNGLFLKYLKSEEIFFLPYLEYRDSVIKKNEDLEVKIWPHVIHNSDGELNTLFAAFPDLIKEHSKESSETVKASIIIPHYNNFENLKLMLSSLIKEIEKLKLSTEIIVVDDGSDKFEINQLAFSNTNYKILCLPRKKQRQRGDTAYRAGVARNAGALYARGETLIFCDCDILISAEAIENICEKINEYDFVMPIREQLKPGHKPMACQIDATDIDVQLNSYWEEFYHSNQDWNSRSNKWKFVSTYCLGMTKDNFLKLGGFSPSFVSYGCEDTELGFRGFKENKKFYLLKSPVYHLQPQLQNSEYQQSQEIKKQILLRAFWYFYQIHQDKIIFEELLQTSPDQQ
jgi:glycosyltransferase involved in cell wall biosynthesis